MAKKYFVYVAKCGDGTFYTGYTNNLEQREKLHNEGKGARYTRGRGAIEIVYVEEFKSKGGAMRREYEIKQMSRVQKKQLILQ